MDASVLQWVETPRAVPEINADTAIEESKNAGVVHTHFGEDTLEPKNPMVLADSKDDPRHINANTIMNVNTITIMNTNGLVRYLTLGFTTRRLK